MQPRPLTILSAAGLVVALITVLLVVQDSGICPPTDSEHHLFNALLYGRTIAMGGLFGLWDTVRASYVGWPPGAYTLLYGPLTWLLGEGPAPIRLYSLALVPLLLWGTYRLGARLGDRKSGTLAALLTLLAVGVTGQLRQVSIDLPATVAVLLCMLALVSTDRFSRLRSTLLFGAACGLCLFSRVQALFFIALPILTLVLVALWRAPTGRQRLRLLCWLAAGAAVALVLSSPWWFGKLGWLWEISTSHMDPTKVNPRGDPGKLAGLVFYLGAIGKLAGWPLFAALLVAVPLLIRRGEARFKLEYLALGLALLGGFLGCVTGVHREPRYMLPGVPLLAVLAVTGLRMLPRRLYHGLGAALFALTAVPTLVLAVHPLEGHHPLVRAGVFEWAYVREPFHVPTQKAADAAAAALARSADLAALQRSPLYLFFLQAQGANYLPRLGAFTVPELPNAVYSFSNNINIVNSPWHVRRRGASQMFVFAEEPHKPDLPLVWTLPAKTYRNRVTVRLYRVPPGHRWHGMIFREDLFGPGGGRTPPTRKGPKKQKKATKSAKAAASDSAPKLAAGGAPRPDPHHP